MLGLETVPEVQYPFPTLDVNNIVMYLTTMRSVYNPNVYAEGLVIRHKDDTATQRRYMAKIRRKDFGL